MPDRVPSHEVLVIQPIGSLFFAGAAELEDDLPDVDDAERAAVVIRLRDRDEVGSTFLRVVATDTSKRFGRLELLIREAHPRQSEAGELP